MISRKLGRLSVLLLALIMIFSIFQLFPVKSKQLTVVINPGHSVGYEPGTTSCKVMTEAQMNERVAIALMKELDTRGYRVFLTHCSDPEYTNRALSDCETCCTLRNVGPICNSVKPDLAISIHHNSAAEVPSSVRGMELYWSSYRDFDNEGVYTDQSLWNNTGGYKDKTPCTYAKESYRLANIIFKQFQNFPNMEKPRSINERDDYLPAHAEAPCILYEGGYLSTPSESQVLLTDLYRDEAAKRLADSIDLFFGNSKPVPGINVSPKEVITTAGSQTQISAINVPNINTNESFTFISADPTVATVDQNGLITGIDEGTTQITVRPNSNNLIEKVINVSVYKDPGVNINYETYSIDGWKNASNGYIAGYEDSGYPVFAFKASLSDKNGNPIDPNTLSLSYQYLTSGNNWSDLLTDGSTAGDESDNKAIEAVKFNLTGTEASNYKLYYRTFIDDFDWTAFTTSPNSSGSEGFNYPMSGIQLLILPAEAEVTPSTEGSSFYSGQDTWSLQYSTHISNIGWTDFIKEGEESGDPNTGESIEALELRPYDRLPDGIIVSETHIANLGWVDSEENIIGTTGRALWIEALKLWLTGDLGNQYDINYQVYVKDLGWTAPAKNGIIAGTTGKALPIQSVKIWLTKK